MKIKDLGGKWFSVYTACLKKYRVKEAAAVARAYRPRKLYKYVSFSSTYWRDNTSKYQIPFNMPSQFNDPFDSRWFLNYDKIWSERFGEIGQRWQREDHFDDETYRCVIATNEEDLMYLHDLFCISCFSTTPYSNPMWGYYGEKHTGFCLEYDTALLPKEMQIMLPVVYTDVPFDASMLLDMRGIDDEYAFICPSLFKSAEWSHEKEWRIFIKNKNYTEPKILCAPNSITGVYFGFRAYSDERDELEMWAINNNIPVHQIERAYGTFELLSENIDDVRSEKPLKGLLI